MTVTKDKPQSHKSEYLCPCCKKPLYWQYGHQTEPGNRDYGMMLFCIHGDPDARTHPQEVAGHGNGRSDEAMMKSAYAVILAKFTGAKYETEGELVPVDTSEVVAVVEESVKKGKRAKRQNPPVVEDDDDSI